MALDQTILALCDGNAEAATLIAKAWNFAIVLDDMVDGDKSTSTESINDAMDFALNVDPFIAEHPGLALVFQSCLAQWRAANQMELEGKQLEVAYVLRCSPYAFFAAVVYVAAGPKRAIEAVRYFHSQGQDTDTLEKYMAEHAPAVAQGV